MWLGNQLWYSLIWLARWWALSIGQGNFEVFVEGLGIFLDSPKVFW